MSKPKICFFSQNMYHLLTKTSNLQGVGGAEVQVLLIAKELARLGFDVSFVTRSFRQDEIEPNLPFKLIPSFHRSEGIPGFRFFYPRVTKVWRAFAEADADIYLTKGTTLFLALLALFARLNHKKVIYSAAFDTNFDPKKVFPDVSGVHRLRDRLLYSWGLRRCDDVIVENGIQSKSLEENFGRKGTLIYNGFPKAGSLSSGDGGILWVARVVEFKNPHLFLNLAKALPDEKFVMVGGAPPNASREQLEFYQKIEAEAKTIPNLDFKGFIPFEKANDEFGRAKLFISTSYEEGFSNTFPQAWSRGVPVISFINPDNLIVDRKLGWVARNYDEMLDLVSKFSRKEITVAPAHVKAWFDENLAIDGVVRHYERLFKSLMGQNGFVTKKGRRPHRPKQASSLQKPVERESL
jgi:glycosyltransferase involved in cell wall biosynthesis